MKLKPLPPIILGVFLLSIIYWIFLAFTTQMQLVNDALGYEELGRFIKDKGFLAYFQEGPKREPIYPLLVALSMTIQQGSAIAYTKIMALFGILILFANQLLTYIILRKLNIRTWVSALILGLLGLSPAINNTAFSLYSEIAAIPLILMAALMTAKAFETMHTKTPKQNFFAGLGLGLLFVAVTMVKSIFEPIFFIFTGIYLILAGKAFLQQRKQLFINSLIFVLSLTAAYEIPISTYKMLNKIHNGHYALTNRGSWALYGSCALRAEPLNPHRIMTAIAHIPGKGACAKFFSEEDCLYWEPSHSDAFGLTELSQTMSNTPAADVDNVIMSDCKKKVLEHPLQFVFIGAIDWIKMFFWESTKIGFVTYPPAIDKLYNTGLFKDGLRLFTSLLSLSAFLIIFWRIKNPRPVFNTHQPSSQEIYLSFTITLIVLFYTLCHALFNTVPRWALPISPLYLICIGYALHQLMPQSKNKK